MPIPYSNTQDIRYLQKTRSDAANAGAVTVATIAGSVEIEKIIVKSLGATTADLANITVTAPSTDVVTFIDAVTGLRANIDAADKQVSWEGAVELGDTKVIRMTFTPVAAGATPVSLLLTIRYRPITAGASIV